MSPILYTSPAFLSSYSMFGAYPLWVANYGVTCPDVPSPWSTYVFWQSTRTGSLAPISGALDLDSFNGTIAQLRALGATAQTEDGGVLDASPGGEAGSGADAAPMGGGATEPPAPADGGPDDSSAASGAVALGSSARQPNGGCGVGPTGQHRPRTLAFVALLGLLMMWTRRRRSSPPLMRLVPTLTATLFLLQLSGTAEAYCRTTTVKIPADFPLHQCFTQGRPLYWKNSCAGYSLSQHVSMQVSFEEVSALTDRAFSRWTGLSCASDGKSGSRVSIDARNLGPVDCAAYAYISTQPNQNVIFFSDDQWPAPGYKGASDNGYVLAKTNVSFNADTGEIRDADIAINTHEKRFADRDPVPSNEYDLEGVLTHEAGHFFGLAHSDDHRAIMYPKLDPSDTHMRSPTNDDILGLCSAYRPDGARALDLVGSSVLMADACDPTPRGGFGSRCPDQSKGVCVVGLVGVPGGSCWPALVSMAVMGALVSRRPRTRRATSPEP